MMTIGPNGTDASERTVYIMVKTATPRSRPKSLG